ncbi:MAG TPA: hypothetical protein VMS96_01710 [Terriglobales bacterium]|nr:hypothetical protein [Terriglobales bacterium]
MMWSEAPGTINKFGRTAWKFQQTFLTPLKDVRRFVETIASAMKPVEKASLTVDTWVFEPKHLDALLAGYDLSPQYRRDSTVTASGKKEVEELLYAALSDWVDFLFVPQPKPFVIYADHDEYTTFYAQIRSNLNRVTKPLSENGFKLVSGYVRRF